MATDGKRAGEPLDGDAEKKAKVAGYKLNINFGVDKEHEPKSFKQLCKLPPGALQGLKEGKADRMLKAFHINTIEDLAKWKHYRVAKAIHTMAALEEEGGRAEASCMNLNLGLDVEHEKCSFKELLELPPSALQGLADWTDTTLKELHIKSISDLATFKYCDWAAAIVTAAEYESTEFEHK